MAPETENTNDQDDAASSANISVHFDDHRDEMFSNSKQTNVIITIAGWIVHSEDDHSLPFSVIEKGVHGDQYSLIWETETLKELGSALKILVSEVTSFIVQQGIQGIFTLFYNVKSWCCLF
jgi:hypothetical protein